MKSSKSKKNKENCKQKTIVIIKQFGRKDFLNWKKYQS
jgi:hypothetical protein